jgi:hypothetical protein
VIIDNTPILLVWFVAQQTKHELDLKEKGGKIIGSPVVIDFVFSVL